MISTLYERLRLPRLARKMRRDWDLRAGEDALHYVNTGRDDWDESDFFATGEQNVKEFVQADLGAICGDRDPAAMRILEIGSGVGRMTRALATTFGEVHGVDVSPEMVRRAREYLAATPNAHVQCNSGTDLRVLGSLEFDFAFSFIVFQHIPSRTVIDRYVGEVSRRLRRGSLFKFQVQGYQGSGLRSRGTDTWLGASVSERQAQEMANRHGFEMRRSLGAGTQYYWLWFYKL